MDGYIIEILYDGKWTPVINTDEWTSIEFFSNYDDANTAFHDWREFYKTPIRIRGCTIKLNDFVEEKKPVCRFWNWLAR